MALDEKREQLGSSRVPNAPKERAPLPEPPKKIDNSAWGGHESKNLRGEDVRSFLERNKNKVYEKAKLSGSEIPKISSEIFGKYGDYIDTNKAEKRVRELEKELKADPTNEKIKKEFNVAKFILGK